jgi:EAL domain-containing protein (putative c-di-GMP-specific phosphodiesterase class I)
VSISIDDFGAAYATFSRLLALPGAELKVDRRFVSGCANDQSKHILCQSAIDLAHKLGSKVCAEGVENCEDFRDLIEMRCDMAQGFLFAKPMPPDLFVEKVIGPAADLRASAQTTRPGCQPQLA